MSIFGPFIPSEEWERECVETDAAGVQKTAVDPITLDFLDGPVVKIDSQCYDAHGLDRWLSTHGTIPHNRRPATATDYADVQAAIDAANDDEMSPFDQAFWDNNVEGVRRWLQLGVSMGSRENMLGFLFYNEPTADDIAEKSEIVALVLNAGIEDAELLEAARSHGFEQKTRWEFTGQST